MKGDFTRETFRPKRHFSGVLRQQGRVDVDADWNEQVAITRHQDVTRTVDLVGPSGGPADGAGFGLSVSGAAVIVGKGRYYVGGVLAENEADVPLAAQPDPPADAVPATAGLHLAYLDVWDRHVNAIDDPVIREVALGGPDTATRARTVWQVRTQALLAGDPDVADALDALDAAADDAARAEALQAIRNLVVQGSCLAPFDPLGGSLAAGTGTMAARSTQDTGGDDLCRFGEGSGGYTRLENRLYRVEIHDPGNDVAATAATFKWSRDNGSVVVSVEEFLDTGPGPTTSEIRVRRLGLDETQELHRDDWIEIVSDDLIARGEPGQLVQIRDEPDPADRILRVTPEVDKKAITLHPQVRRWDLPVGGLARVRKSWQELEAGVEVLFGAGTYHAGDYWVIPARMNTGDVEWPPFPEYPGHDPQGRDGNLPPELLPPRGVAHWRAVLAALVHDGTQVVASIDLRQLFPAATDLLVVGYAGGDGQEPEWPSGHVPDKLRVSVTNGSQPVAGVLVRFSSESNADHLVAGSQTGSSLDVATGPDGIAEVDWTLNGSSILAEHRVMASLIDECQAGTRAPIVFSTRVNYQLHYLGGDGQEGMPGETLQPLRAWVSAGRWPVQGATVQFTRLDGTGPFVQPGPTGADGVAECIWTLDSTTPVQRIAASLLDVNSDQVHAATIIYTANLSVAARVAYTPAGDCADLATVTTVQEALDQLCRREEGGDCTYTIRDGDDLAARWAAILAAGFDNGAICFAEGTWVVDEPLRMYRKRNVTIHGVGRASRIIARKSETAFQFEQCQSVTFSDLAVESSLATTRDGLGGAVSMLDCGPVTVERVAVVVPSAPEPLVSGIAVTRGPESEAVGPTRIHDCDLAIGEQQTGILVVNGDVVQVEGNTLRSSPFPEGTQLREYLANARYRAAARRQLVDPEPQFREHRTGPTATPPTTERAPTRVDAGRVIRFRVGTDNQSVAFRSTMTSADVWTALVTESATTPREALARAVAIADIVLRNEGEIGDRRVFKTWFQEIEARWEAIGARGIVVAGMRAGDVRIVGNDITGHLQGISVALSADDRTAYRTAVAVIEGNAVRLPAWSLVARYAEGIFVGNCDSAIVDGNMVIVGEGVQSEPSLVADGIRAGGVFGARLLIRSNHFDATVVGIRIEPTQPRPPHMRRWVASDNVNVGGLCLEAPCDVMEDANVPARPVACPIDRPI